MEARHQYFLQAPAVPMKSPTRFLNINIQPTKSLMDDAPFSPAAAPHDVYLSSEEDVSSSADDFSDFDLESDSDSTPQSPQSRSSRRSHEDTARVVSFIYYGKPSIVTLSPKSRSASNSPTYMPLAAQRGLPHASTEPNRPRRSLSVSSSASSGFFNSFRGHTKNKSSLTKPSFLGNDPFAEKELPSTPTLSVLKRTFTLSKKQSKLAMNPVEMESRERLSIRAVSMDIDELKPPVQIRPSTSMSRGPVKYQDIVMAARNRAVATPPPQASDPEARPTATGAKSRLRSGLSLGRKFTVKVLAE